MLPIETQKQIAKLLKIDEAAFLEAVKSEKEAEVKIPEVQVFTSQELASRDQNQKKSGYDEGKGAGLEMFVKDQKEKLGLDFEGKDPEKFVNAFQAKILADAKAEPNQKLQEKDGIIAKLQGTVKEYEDKYNAVQQEKKGIMMKTKLTSVVPSGLPVDADEVLLSMQSRGYSFEEDDKGSIIPKRNGEVIRDAKTQDALDHKAVIENYVTNERKWKPAADDGNKQGRGGGSDRRTSGLITSMKEAKEQWEGQGKSINTAEFQAYVQDAAKTNKEFNWDE